MGNPDLATPAPIVDKLIEAAQKPMNHRCSLSKGIPNLRKAVCDRYARLYSTVALNGPEDCVHELCDIYRERRDRLIEGLKRIGWDVPSPKATMFVWARISEAFRKMGSVEFSKLLLTEAQVAVSPGLGFGSYGDEYVRFALIENEHRTRQGIGNMRRLLSGAPE